MADCEVGDDAFLTLFDMNGFIDAAIDMNPDIDEVSDDIRAELIERLNGYALNLFEELDQSLAEQAATWLEEIDA